MKHIDSIADRLHAMPRLLTLKQAAEELGLPVWTLRRAIWGGELAAVHVGRMVRIDCNDLEVWLARHKIHGPAL